MLGWNISEGDLVRIRTPSRKSSGISLVEIGTVIKRTYLAYDAANCKWQVLVDNKIREYKAEKLFLINRGHGNEHQ
jgi:hypothetical protein